MTVTLIGQASNSPGFSVTIPAGAAAGDVAYLLATASIFGSAAINPPAGWTSDLAAAVPVDSQGDPRAYYLIAHKVLVAGDPGSTVAPAWNGLGTIFNGDVQMAVYRGVAATGGLATLASGSDSYSFTGPSTTAPLAGRQVSFLVSQGDHLAATGGPVITAGGYPGAVIYDATYSTPGSAIGGPTLHNQTLGQIGAWYSAALILEESSPTPYIAVGAGNNGTTVLATSPDTITWTPQITPADGGQLADVAAGIGNYVAVGYDSGGNAAVLHSTDGAAWTNTYTPPGASWLPIGVAYGSGLFVVLGVGLVAPTDGPVILTSPNGVTWTAQTTTFDNVAWDVSVSDIVFGNGLFVASLQATGPGAPTRGVMTSPDGIIWTVATDPTAPSSGTAPTLGFGNSTWVALDEASRTVYATTDGVHWTSATIGPAGIFGMGSVTWDPSGGLWAVQMQKSVGGATRIYTSPNLSTWTAQTGGGTAKATKGGDGLWTGTVLLVGAAGEVFQPSTSAASALISSPDGAAWTQVSSVFDSGGTTPNVGVFGLCQPTVVPTAGWHIGGIRIH